MPRKAKTYCVSISFQGDFAQGCQSIIKAAKREFSDAGFGLLAGLGGNDCLFDNLTESEANQIKEEVSKLLFVKTIKIAVDN